MIKKIKRPVFFQQFSSFPKVNRRSDTFFFPDVYAAYNLHLSSNSIIGFGNRLGKELSLLVSLMGIEKLFFAGDSSTPWLHQKNSYKPASDAIEYLNNFNLPQGFNGALLLELKDLPEFIKHLFWLTRCNASLPDFYFCDQKMGLIGHVCKYGNIHIYILEEEVESSFDQALNNTKFEMLEGNNCFEQFSKSSRIVGRQIVI
nr:hypothetical protein [uncultured Mucilaginibacter sp.]